MVQLLSKAQILEAQDLRTEDVPVPEWGGVVRVRGLTGAERDRFEERIIQQRSGGRVALRSLVNVRARLVSLACVDEAGARLFDERDVAALGQKSAAALERVFDVASRLSGLAPGDVEDLEKNWPSGPSAASGSG